jgi:serine protease AprX
MRRHNLTVFFIALAMIVPYTAQAAPTGSGEEPPPPLADRDGDRLSDGLESILAEIRPGERLDVIVTWEGPPDIARAEERVGPLDIRHRFGLIDGFSASVTPAQARGLARVPGVFRVEEDFEVTATMEEADLDYGTDRARTDFSVTGAGIDVCVLDTGADPGHEQLDNGKILGFFDVINGQTEPYDDHDHGTHVSGILAGDGAGASPDADRYGGVAPAAGLYVAKVLSSSGSGSATGIIEGIEWCVGQGVDLLSMSLGTAGGSDGNDSLSQAVDSAVDAGVVAVVAAGNSGDGTETVGAPGAAEKAVTVGAAGKFARGLHLAPFSSRGPTLDGRLKPDLAAPGVAVVSADANTTSGYFAASGTSMATPFVAGTVALMLDADGSLDPTGVKTLLRSTSTDLGVTGVDVNWGHGLLDGYGAVAGATGGSGGERTLPVHSVITGSVPNGGQTSHSIVVDGAEAGHPLAITLLIEGQMECASSFFGLCLAYEWSPDLDARLIAPDGTSIDSRCPLEGNCGSAGQQETFVVRSAQEGEYTLEVYPYDGSPNNGKGGSYLVDVFQGSTGTASEPGNAVPTAEDDIYTTDEDTLLNVEAANGVLSNDTDPDGDTLTATVSSAPGNGSLTLNGDGSFVYTPNADWNGTDSFTYTASDGKGGTDTATVTVTVHAVNDLPVADAGPDVTVTDDDGDRQESVTLDGSGSSDVEGISTYEWTVGDLVIATGATPTVIFELGAHIVTLTVTDTDGASDSDEVVVTVQEAATVPDTIHVGDLDGTAISQRNVWQAEVTVTIHDGADAAVADATVTLAVSTGEILSCVTGDSGTCSVTSLAVPKREGTITFSVQSVTAGAGDYDAAANHDPDGDSDGTTIVISK